MQGARSIACGAALALLVLASPSFAGQPLGPLPEQPAAPVRASEAERIAFRADAGKSTAKSSSSSWDATRVLLSLSGVVALIFLLRWGSRKFLGISAASSLGQSVRIVGRTTLSPRQQLILLQVGKRLVLVANSGSSVSTLCQITDDDEVAGLLGSARRSGASESEFSEVYGKEQAKLSAAENSAEDDLAIQDQSPVDADEGELKQTRQEIGGLLEKVKLLSQAFKR